jgi:predicted unusual protein kinase regulating ubiquinone biosynthesis (AarF/ABC1/UbiB family)
VPTGMVNRFGRLAATSLKGSMRLALLGPRSLIGKDSPAKLLEDLHLATAEDLVETLGRLKGTSMKLGQLASFIDAGVLPADVRDMYQNVLGSLRDAAPPMKRQLVGEVFRHEFGADPEQLFATFSEEPLAAASLGQVHLATTKEGQDVAVKVQYPGIEDAIRSDLAVTAAVKPLMPLLAPGLDAADALEEMRARMLEECDYLLEAENMDTLADRYEDHPFVWVPRSVPELSTERILTMGRATGRPFAEIVQADQAERDRVGEMLFRFYYGSLYRYGFTSADPHPGNYFLMDGGPNGIKGGKMAFFDFGLACNLDMRMMPYLYGAFLALRDGDVQGVFRNAVSMRYVTKPQQIDPQRFYDWVRLVLDPIAEDRDYTFTRDFIAERTATMLDPRNPWWSFLRQLNLPRWAILLYRLELGLFAVLAQLGATANWHRMTLEFYEAGEPSTELGRAEAEWLKTHPK